MQLLKQQNYQSSGQSSEPYRQTSVPNISTQQHGTTVFMSPGFGNAQPKTLSPDEQKKFEVS